ncbi:MAG: hypothetical protein HY817_03830 [Candidatus Abawacabacteria bacterium]|nr:hypothetical protein [Candidatus Abawacabacteria bacterium]
MSYPIDLVEVGDTITYTSEQQKNSNFMGISAKVLEKEKLVDGNYRILVEVEKNVEGEKVVKEITPAQIVDSITRTLKDKN